MYARLARLSSAVGAIAIGFLALWVLETSRLSTPIRLSAVQPRSTRVVAFLIDSLAAQEATDPAYMPRLVARVARSRALHGPVRPCADAVTVPCITAMLTGNDRFSVFALGRNFGGAALETNVLSQLMQRGLRVGYVGEVMLRNTFKGLSFVDLQSGVDDALNLRRALEVLARRDLDLLIVHLRELDELAHKIGTRDAAYRERAREIDTALDAALNELPATDQVVVLGDHGHTVEGRHFAGLDVPSYAAYFGSALPSALARPMAITDHGAIWARLFGLRFGARSWVDDYFDRKTVAVPEDLPALPSHDRTPWWGFLGAALLGVGVLWSPAARRGFALSAARMPLLASALVGLALAVGLGLAWLSVRPLLAYVPLFVALAVVMVTGLAGGLLLAPAVRAVMPHARLDRWVLPLLGALVFALPTIYKYGGPFAGLTWLGIAIASLAVRAWPSDRRLALGIAALWIPFYTAYNPAVRNFSVRWFPVYAEWLPAYATVACVLWLAVALVIATRRRLGYEDVAALFVGVVLAGARDLVPAWTYLPLCTIALPLCVLALTRAALWPAALAVTLPALWFWFEGDGVALAPVAAVMVLWAALPALVPARLPLARGATVLALLVASFWTSMGCRMGGVSYDFFFAWLPETLTVTDAWIANTVFALLKYLSVPLFGLLLAARSAGPRLFAALGALEVLVPARIAYTLGFFAAFSFASPHAGPFIASDIVQEVTLWLLLRLVVAFLPEGEDAVRAAQAEETELAAAPASAQAA